jgi:hypothetical protein
MQSINFVRIGEKADPHPLAQTSPTHVWMWTGKNYQWVEKDHETFLHLHGHLKEFLLSLPRKDRIERMKQFVEMFNEICVRPEEGVNK